MSTTDRETRVALPRSVDGERLDRATSHERSEAMPNVRLDNWPARAGGDGPG